VKWIGSLQAQFNSVVCPSLILGFGRCFKRPAPEVGSGSWEHTRSAITPVAVQQKLMRHADIRTAFNIYGDVVTNEMAPAHSKVVRLPIPKAS